MDPPAAARAEMARGALATAAGGQQVAAVLGRSPGGLVAVKGRGKGREGLGEPVPHLDLGRGAVRRSVHGGGRRATEVSVAAALGAREEAVRRWRRLWSSEARREAYL